MPMQKDPELFDRPRLLDQPLYSEIGKALRHCGAVRLHIRMDPLEVSFIDREIPAELGRLDARREHRAEFHARREDRALELADPSRGTLSIYAPNSGGGTIMVVQCHSYPSVRPAIEELEYELESCRLLELGHSRIVADHAADAEKPYAVESHAMAGHPLSSIVEPFYSEDDRRLAAFWRDIPDEDPSILWYPSSALDLSPLDLLATQLFSDKGIKVPDVAVYTCLGYPPVDELIATAKPSGPSLSNSPESFSVIPVRLNRRLVRRRIMNDYMRGREEVEDPSIPDGAAMVFPTMGTQAPKHKLLYLKVSNRAFEYQVVRRGLCNPTFYCSITDGCGFGGNRRCEADIGHLDRLFQTHFFSPRYWLTNHIRTTQSTHWFRAQYDDDFDLAGLDLAGRTIREYGLSMSSRIFRIE